MIRELSESSIRKTERRGHQRHTIRILLGATLRADVDT